MTWSSKQQLNQEDLVCLQDVLLALSLRLEKRSQNPLDIMMNWNFGDMTRNISIENMLESILINRGSE